MFKVYLANTFFFLATFFLGVAGNILASLGAGLLTIDIMLVVIYLLVAAFFGVAHSLVNEVIELRNNNS